MGCKKYMRPVYRCQHVLPVPKVSCPSETRAEGYSCSHHTKIQEVLDGKCPYMVRVTKEIKNDDFETILQITCAHISPLGRRCSCAKAIAEANGKKENVHQLTLFELEEA